MKAHLIDTHLLVPRSRSSAKVKVKYQGHVSQKMGVSGALVFHKHILFSLAKMFYTSLKIHVIVMSLLNSKVLDWTCFYSLPNDKILDLSKLKAFADDILYVIQIFEICFGKDRKHCGNGENAGY